MGTNINTVIQETETPNTFDFRKLLKYLLSVTLIYCVVGLLGITTSHTSTLFGNVNEKSNVILGEARQQRADEFLRGSPRVIAYLRGIEATSYTPLDYTGTLEFQQNKKALLARINYSFSPINEIVIDQVSQRLPLQMGFSLLWWQNVWLLFAVLPVWFFLLGRNLRTGILAAVLFFFSASNSWFSYLPSNLIAQAVASACLVMIALKLLARRKILWSIVAVLLAIYAGRFAFTVIQYPPWGIPVIMMVAVVTVQEIFISRDKWQVLRHLLMVLASGAVAILCVYIYNRRLYDVALSTVYPGGRRESGGNASQSLWSGGLAWFFESTFARRGGFTNPEIILGPTFIVFPTFLLLFQASIRDLIDRRLRQTVTALLIGVLILICWSQVHWPKWALFMNPLVFIPAGRADQIVGVIAVLPLVIILTSKALIQIKTSTCVVATLFVVAFTSRDMQAVKLEFLPNSGESVITFSIIIVALITFSLLKFESLVAKMLPLVIFVIGSSLVVNPLVSGVGALEKSNAVTVLKELAETSPNGRWATTGFYQDALMISTGVPQLSGQQPYGPNAEAWRKIDTQSKFEDNWNRGQAYIQFAWDPRKEIAIWNPSGDVIQVVISPCDSRLQDLQLHWVMSPAPLSYQCLKVRKQIEWMGLPVYIYEVLNSPMFDNRNFDFSS